MTGTFLLNDHYALVLFDSSADKSFIFSEFSTFLGIVPSPLEVKYLIELANGKQIEAAYILKECHLDEKMRF